MALNEARDTSRGGIFYPLAVVTLVVLVVGLAAAYGATLWIDGALREKAMDVPTSTHIKTVGAQPYLVPAALMPNAAQHTDGFADRMDMTLALPLGPGGVLVDVVVTVQPRGRTRTSAALLDTVYLHQFGADQTEGVPGLIGKPLGGDAGVSGETVWYDPLSPNPFVAKCMTPVEPNAARGTCLRTFQLSDRNTAIVTFDPAALANWRQFDAVVEAWLETLRQ
ncbi:hypothetical protein [Pelagibacterium xiamenense]|uniref:hypothetical protein n=1 Tax=Pelagibacterium xiamenense TaxID=2901140 RepID=UPI001E52E702|nr:hypothetical protein [Pelagibacterium xiamenense]MCD7059921.1 hypothetical protein [Pelagibacterium xiamenense]